ncbi:transcriptional regulator [Sphingomonas ginkgonis]|uniref:Transcriptional regulator n=1 Tax=Sphingomonas ginkgonis TaxID=2315330 RepID=A0A3R9Y6P2_9SPHN|nr:MucR family transcriptional regulator [Sphingomonas ginkgonis]RST31328.1 transcriptional regulator [Sphingomonas ginkgonis]
MADEQSFDAVELATELTIAWLSNPNNRAHASEVPAVLQTMHKAVQDLCGAPTTPSEQAGDKRDYTPAVTARRSLASPDHIISMIDGKPYKTLKRHLSTHGLTPVQYRERYGLKPDYPMVAPTYSAKRRETAHQIGLGRKRRTDADESAVAKAAPGQPESKRRRRKSAAVAAE